MDSITDIFPGFEPVAVKAEKAKRPRKQKRKVESVPNVLQVDPSKPFAAWIGELLTLPDDARIDAINEIKLALHSVSPFQGEPVDCVLWVRGEQVESNDYNPNSVAPPEMELLKVSILEDGYTQPIVTFKHDGKNEVVDGFHRNRVGKECAEVKERVRGYLPVVQINDGKSDKGDRIASTIRHNRARGKHRVESMSDIVIELKRRNWSEQRIGRDLGMDPDEILRLCQITGLAEMFKDQDFSKSWEIDDFVDDQPEVKLE